ncbi:MAG: hypothetical protein EOM40_00215 [Clostridia bacterium]|nr:hypothetical protein [Clostridia bacterium]NCC41984.1 hypothetical protein [Clostridia bacterium]
MTKLRLVMGKEYDRTVVKDCFYTSPMKIGTPRQTGDLKKVVLMMASAGVLKGDRFDYQITCEDQTKTELTEQSYTKIFDTQDGEARKKVEITVGENAVLDYHPCPVIPFQNSSFEGETRIMIRNSSIFFYSEVTAAGRIAMGERFEFRSFKNKTIVYLENEPVYLEHTHYIPQKQHLDSLFYFDGYTHQGSMYCYFPDIYISSSEFLDKIAEGIESYKKKYSLSEKEILYGVTEAKKGFAIRILGNQAQDIEEIFEMIRGCNG